VGRSLGRDFDDNCSLKWCIKFQNALGLGRSPSGGFADEEGRGLIQGIEFPNALRAGRNLRGGFADKEGSGLI